MIDLFFTVPFLGRIYAHRDTVTTARLSVETLHSPPGKEWLLCCGSLRIYFTPAAALAGEGRPPEHGRGSCKQSPHPLPQSLFLSQERRGCLWG